MVVPPMASGTADTRGFATEATRAHYRRLARSGAGLVMVEYSFVHASGRSETNQLAADQDDKIPGLARIAAAIQAEGALAGLQLVHAGGKTERALNGGVLFGASAVSVPVKDRALEIPQEMTLAEIANLREWYARAASRARRAGFDLVELHAAHGYGLNQWLSPLTNRRRDRYGGSLRARSRLLFETLAEARRELTGELALAVRLPGQDHAPGGLRPAEMSDIASQLEARGLADLIDVSSGIGGWRRPQGRSGEGYLVADAARIKHDLKLPVIGVGGIETMGFIDQALSQGWLDFAAVGRAILKDPDLWRTLTLVRKAAAGAQIGTL